MEPLCVLTEEEKCCLQHAVSTAHVIRTHVREELAKQVAAEVKELYQTHIRSPELSIFQLAAIGSSKIVDITYRNDVKCWITPSLCKDHNLTATPQLVKALVNLCAKQLKTQLDLNGDYSVQLACFPGNGSRYIRHKDSFFDSNGRPTNASSSSGSSSYRKLTCIYYLNDELDGGQLRIFHPHDSSFEDVEASLGTLVLFRSEIVEHEVLPSSKNRFAITIWASSTCRPAQSLSTTFLPKDHDNSWKLPLSLNHLNIDEDIKSCAKHKSIYVSLANYRDSEAPKTILDLFLKAAVPERVYVGHVFQGTEEEKTQCTTSQVIQDQIDHEADNDMKRKGFRQWSSSHVKTIHISLHEATGPCYARHLALQPSLFSSQDYILQIDSHMRFRPGWDSYLIALLEKIKSEQPDVKPVITTYPLGYTLPNNVPNSTLPTILLPTSFDNHGVLRQSSKVAYIESISSLPYLKSPLWAAGFSFSESKALLEVPYDPNLPFLFFGEEISMAARFFTHGYRFYAPSTNVLYHLYSRSHRPNFTQSEAAKNHLQPLRDQSMQKLTRMLLEEESPHNIGFSLGKECSLADMERELDVNFKQKILQHSASVNPEYWIEYMVPSPYSDTLESTALKLSASTDVVEDEKLLVEEILRTQLQELSSTNNMNSVFGKVCLYLNK